MSLHLLVAVSTHADVDLQRLIQAAELSQSLEGEPGVLVMFTLKMVTATEHFFWP